jgi:fumarylacetoacetase
MTLPVAIGDYTDFYASIDHATHIGSMFRPENPLLPNYRYVPIAYHGRASTVRVSGAAVRRPCGQVLTGEGSAPEFRPSRRLDYELELGFFVGPGNPEGEPIPMAQAEEHIFGLCLLNDWSARDMQRWEYQPLGPFLAKNFATTVSPWIVPMEALQPFRIPARQRAAGDPAPLPYLFDEHDQQMGGLDLTIEVWLQSEAMVRNGHPPVLLSRGNAHSLYWTLAQMLTHHASNGCVLRPGDLMGSGTVSGAEKGEYGCLQELTWGGRDPVSLPGGELRRALEDGDTVLLRGSAHRPGYPTISLGECRGQIAPALLLPDSTTQPADS